MVGENRRPGPENRGKAMVLIHCDSLGFQQLLVEVKLQTTKQKPERQNKARQRNVPFAARVPRLRRDRFKIGCKPSARPHKCGGVLFFDQMLAMRNHGHYAAQSSDWQGKKAP